jgi:hypothetical protein
MKNHPAIAQRWYFNGAKIKTLRIRMANLFFAGNCNRRWKKTVQNTFVFSFYVCLPFFPYICRWKYFSVSDDTGYCSICHYCGSGAVSGLPAVSPAVGTKAAFESL